MKELRREGQRRSQEGRATRPIRGDPRQEPSGWDLVGDEPEDLGISWEPVEQLSFRFQEVER